LYRASSKNQVLFCIKTIFSWLTFCTTITNPALRKRDKNSLPSPGGEGSEADTVAAPIVPLRLDLSGKLLKRWGQRNLDLSGRRACLYAARQHKPCRDHTREQHKRD
jgi:hypothetical protein